MDGHRSWADRRFCAVARGEKRDIDGGLDTAMHRQRFKDIMRDRVARAARTLARKMPTRKAFRRGSDRVGRFIRENPISAAVGATVIGFVLGILLPATEMEVDRLRDVKR